MGKIRLEIEQEDYPIRFIYYPAISPDKTKFCFLTRLPEKDSELPHVVVDEVLGLMCDIGSERSSNDAVPCWIELSIEFLLDVGSDIFFDIVSLQSLAS